MNRPAMRPPPGVTPNFVDPPNMNKLFTIIAITSTCIGTPMVVIRLYTKWAIRKKVLPEDSMIGSKKPKLCPRL